MSFKFYIPKSTIEQAGGMLALYRADEETKRVEYLERNRNFDGLAWNKSCVSYDTLIFCSVPAPANYHADEIEFVPSRFADQFDYLQQLEKQIKRYEQRIADQTKKKK
jgi:hypothetical protein